MPFWAPRKFEIEKFILKFQLFYNMTQHFLNFLFQMTGKKYVL